MSKKSKKKRRKSSSSSSDEDVKESREQDATKYRKGVKRKQDENCQGSCAKEQDQSVSSTLHSQSTRQIKKPVYRLEKTRAPEEKPVNKEEHCRKSKGDPVPFHGEKCSGKAKNYTSGKDKSVRESKTVESGPSKSVHAAKSGRKSGRAHKSTEKTRKGRLDKKSPQKSSPKLKKQLMSPSLVSAEQDEQSHDVRKRKCFAEETPKTKDDSTTVKTSEASSSSILGHPSHQKTRELVKQMCQWFEETKSKSKTSSPADSKTSSASTSKTSSTAAKPTTAESSSKVSKNVTSRRTAPLPSSWKQISFVIPPVPPKFKIPKKVQPKPVESKVASKDAVSATKNLKRDAKTSDSGVSTSMSKQETVQQSQSFLDVTPNSEEKSPSVSNLPQATSDTRTEPWYDEMQVVEELHLARSEKRLELNVLQSYGELTRMDIDIPEERPAEKHYRQTPQQGLILILDTNILLSHLDYVKKMRFHGLGGLGFPLVLIPWVVLQELDSLKRGRGLSGSVAHLATPAISYIHNSLKSREPHLWGQSMQQAAESCNGLNAENNDDRVLQCCLQYQSLYPECAVILCTNDKNLCSKALLSGVNALSKNDLEAEAERSRGGPHNVQNIQAPVLPRISPQISPALLRRSCAPAQPHGQEKTCLSAALAEKGCKQLSEGDEEATEWDLGRCVSKLEDCLREVLSDVLEVEMKAAYEGLWLEIVYIKPPWTLQDVLQCVKKHWIAVFGHTVPRRHLQTVLNLIDFFRSGTTVDRSATSAALQEAKELVKAFQKSSGRVPRAISVINGIVAQLQPQKRPPLEDGEPRDVIMNDDDEDRQPVSAQTSHKDVWAVFEGLWSNVYQISVLCSAPGLEEVQSLLSVFHSNKILNEESPLTAKDFHDCFSQPEYREKLRVGGSQLMELRDALDRCVQATPQRST
ncbi:transcriptional protein SWT1 isoform X2 [Mugil cephalus]|uniref:transcriptional protein SWT1 isoform X2 n=1 Tax=Mugil cephalus TaxID=48193 RepID=UPI001FB66429|nr:transcriptional protein SWT1 isoform X2 [Mugil cephalus]